jgi:uncharacterized cupin superfamily protein
MLQPVVFAAPAHVWLDSNPVCPDWIIEGTPQARAKRLARSADGTSSIMAWSCTPGCFECYYAVDETAHIIQGEAFVTDDTGRIHRLGPRDMAFFPAGSRSIWRVTKEMRKLAVCRHSLPRPLGFLLRAWNKVVNRVIGFPTSSGLGEGAPAAAEDARVATA